LEKELDIEAASSFHNKEIANQAQMQSSFSPAHTRICWFRGKGKSQSEKIK
jgi:hypothetical protein